jgi:uncharacterized protein
METIFEWNPKKARINLQNHQVDFEEASTIFDDPEFITFLDEEHSRDEEWYITIAFSDKNRLLLVAHSERNNTIRIISA